jgi:23S rRNA (adenine2503-C2)-methyltransferase
MRELPVLGERPGDQAGERPAAIRPARDPRPGLSGVPPGELAAWFEARGEPAFRARQVEQAVWAGVATRAADLTTLPKALAAAIDDTFRWSTVSDDTVVTSDGGQTEKILHRLSDGTTIESVLMHYPARAGRRARHTLCISSQGGCAVGCPFCATGELGFERDLETAEILDQVRSAVGRLAKHEGRPGAGATATAERLTNVVFMGMGEPLLNLDRVLEAVAALNDASRLGLGARHITVSTSGVVPGIRRLTALGPQFTLAISLHAARDSLRDVLVPLNRRWPVAEVVAAARDHARATGRRISYEMTMIGGVNDTDADADAVATLLKGDLAHVNLIPMNPVAHTPWRASEMPVIERFAARIQAAGIPVTIRRNRGVEIGAACGQLAAERAGAPAAPAVARRRRRLEAQSARALRGERSQEPLPAGVE